VVLATSSVGIGPILALAGIILALLVVDLVFFARGREPTIREGVAWSIGWLVLSLAFALVVYADDGGQAAVEYTTVYLIERCLSLDNLFVFLILFSYFGIRQQDRSKLLFVGIVAALIVRGVAIIAGVRLLEQFDWVTYVLGALLLFLAYRVYRGAEEEMDPESTLWLRALRKVIPVDTDRHDGSWFAREGGKWVATPMVLAACGFVLSDIAFAVDSIPAAFGITRDQSVIWAANAFALLGLRALFVLIDDLVRRLRYLDETIALVLSVVALKLLLEQIVHIGPLVSLATVFVAFAIGTAASLLADRREAEESGEDSSELRRRRAEEARTD
jgi:tellurite resistance protein TerC